MPVPPLVWLGLRIALWRILPFLLSAKRCEIEVAPDGPHRLIAAIVDEICPKDLVAVAEEHVVAVPFIHAKVLVEGVGNRVPGHLPPHALLHARNLRLRC